MYICNCCAQKHRLATKAAGVANGFCEICWKRDQLIWTDELRRSFPGDGLLTTEEQLAQLAATNPKQHQYDDIPDGQREGL
jgi:hypothetical protein